MHVSMYSPQFTDTAGFTDRSNMPNIPFHLTTQQTMILLLLYLRIDYIIITVNRIICHRRFKYADNTLLDPKMYPHSERNSTSAQQNNNSIDAHAHISTKVATDEAYHLGAFDSLFMTRRNKSH